MMPKTTLEYRIALTFLQQMRYDLSRALMYTGCLVTSTSTAAETVIKYPILATATGSLSYIEKILLGNFLLLKRPRTIVELGVFQAHTTEFICQFLTENQIEARVYGFDLPKVVTQLRTESRIQNLESSGQLQLIPGMLPESLTQWLAEAKAPVDFALVDATHEYWSVWQELSLLWDRLSPQGCMLCHDYSAKHSGVRLAVDHFAARHGAMLLPLTSSTAAQQAGHGSVLVALSKREHHNSLSMVLRHRWMALKVDLLRVPAINAVWSKIRSR